MTTPRCDMPLGELLVHLGACSSADIQNARSEQFRRAEHGDTALLGEVLVEKGKVTREALNDALQKQREIRRDPRRAVGVVLELARRRTDHLEMRLSAGGAR